ncbi:hypothetical protein [Hymenobacter sp. BT559]|jgi:hypothetical protein|uniref:hypothetical protein n=1 Tax=Hymenobacter sp. BT559 TaxID=2795729 RepID=UPI0018ED87F2|nr:hypothetical protein [Hymenobacter sp. BT559]MBJ6145737.1 hypothetical protein [Hymenobacter sp. BT559]
MSLASYTAPAQRREGDKTLIQDLTAAYKQIQDLTGAMQTLMNRAEVELPKLASVATSGSYGDLEDVPTIPAAYTDEQAAEASKAVVDAAVTGLEIGLPINEQDFTVTTDEAGVATDIGVNYSHVLGRATASYNETTKTLTLRLSPEVEPLVLTLNITSSTSSATAPTSPTFTALTSSGFIQNDGANPLTYNAGPPAYWLAAQSAWNGGGNTGKWPLRLPINTAGGLRQRVIDPSVFNSLCGLTLRTVDSTNHASNVVNIELYVNNGKIGYILNGTENLTSISIAAGEYLLLIIGTTVKGYRSVDGTALTELVKEFTNVDPTTAVLYPGQNGHFGSKLGEPAHYGFVA